MIKILRITTTRQPHGHRTLPRCYPLVSHFEYTSPLPSRLWPNMTSSSKPEVNNALHRHRRTEPRPQLTSTENVVKFWHAGFEIFERTDTQIYKHTDNRNTSHPYQGRSNKNINVHDAIITYHSHYESSPDSFDECKLSARTVRFWIILYDPRLYG